MLTEAIRQVNEWGAGNIQAYCREITRDAIEELLELGFYIEAPEFRGHHLFGIHIPDPSKLEIYKQRLLSEKVYVSYRGNSIRVSPHVYNTKSDLEKLVSCFR